MTTDALETITDPQLGAEASIEHGFFTRAGGVSQGIYAGLNTGIGSDDDSRHVATNRARIAARLGVEADALCTVHQVHSPDVVNVTVPLAIADRPKADAMVTNKPGLALGILTADCGPILFADAKAGVIGGAHAGWKGAIGGVIANTVKAMETLGATKANITAVLGPCISQQNYEVGEEFHARFVSADPANSAFFVASQKAGHFMFDLPQFVIRQAAKAGIGCVWTGQCTYADERRFFSYRRTTHRAEPDYGRGLSAIVLKG
ncbi:MAG: peptidoglycan editing factor PgeF [Ahrensia sp.]